MELDLDKMAKQLEKALKNLTQEDIDKYFPDRKVPKGWVSIEEHLPMWYAIDVAQGYSEYKIKYADGKEDTTRVTDHSLWYYEAKERGVTHWWND